jgi:hypothetical protein
MRVLVGHDMRNTYCDIHMMLLKIRFYQRQGQSDVCINSQECAYKQGDQFHTCHTCHNAAKLYVSDRQRNRQQHSNHLGHTDTFCVEPPLLPPCLKEVPLCLRALVRIDVNHLQILDPYVVCHKS